MSTDLQAAPDPVSRRPTRPADPIRPEATTRLLRIHEVAELVALTPRTIRYYEEVGLLLAPARVSGRRRYDCDVLGQLAVIRLAQSAGFTVAETRTFLHGFAPDTPPPDRWQQLAAEKLPAVEALPRASSKRAPSSAVILPSRTMSRTRIRSSATGVASSLNVAAIAHPS